MRASYEPYRLIFRQPSGTSRGVLTYKDTYFLRLWDEANPEVVGLGECALFKGLSKEDNDQYETKLQELCRNISNGEPTDLSNHSSIQFGLEAAIQDFSNGGKRIYFPSPFTWGHTTIPINGLVWMGKKDEMMTRIDEKVAQGFHTIKLKVGAIDFESELDMVKYIRSRYSSNDLTIRLDANGGFTPSNALQRLEAFAQFNIHSIEQPIKQNQWEAMGEICEKSPIDIALDEELIGITNTDEMEKLVSAIRPKYLILKPSLMGGLQGSIEWLRTAQRHDIGAWVTSALESNVGLNFLAQWVATLQPRIPQGLGTGGLFTNNIESPLYLDGEKLCYKV